MMSLRAGFVRFVFVVALLAGCARAGTGAGEAPSNKPVPTSVAQAEEMKRAGTSWEDAEIRAAYLRMVAAIGPANEAWKQEHLPAEERARRAFQMRHDARQTTRAMMKNAAEIALLQKRDQEKYGNPDGPTFEMLVERERKKGLTGDDVYEAIVKSAQRTDQSVNELFGLKGSAP
ncbi:Hypothetical protein A7982_08592 [Minicystis rosea]|nr:Hypothetical protein A7982_08592 [Minicystis rosea]